MEKVTTANGKRYEICEKGNGEFSVYKKAENGISYLLGMDSKVGEASSKDKAITLIKSDAGSGIKKIK